MTERTQQQMDEATQARKNILLVVGALTSLLEHEKAVLHHPRNHQTIKDCAKRLILAAYWLDPQRQAVPVELSQGVL